MKPWQFRVEPYEDETLSSWLVRTALFNYTHLYALFSHSSYNKSYYKYDFDIFQFPADFYIWLSEVSTLSMEELESMTLRTYTGYLQEEVTTHPKQPWIISMGQRKARGYRFCPACLVDAAYYRKDWRLLHINVCEKHHCYLIDECPECKEQVVPQRLDENKKVYNCYNCCFDLRDTNMECLAVSNQYFLIQKRLIRIIEDGYYIQNGMWQYSVGIFNILHQLVMYFIREEHKNKRQRYTTKVSDISPKLLAEIIKKSMLILEEWPLAFETFCYQNHISNHFRLFEKFEWKSLPLWFVNEFEYILQKKDGKWN